MEEVVRERGFYGSTVRERIYFVLQALSLEGC